MASIGTTLERHQGVGPGFDLLRLGLAALIILTHCFALATGSHEVLGNRLGEASHAAAMNVSTVQSWLDWVRATFLRKRDADEHLANVLVPMFFAISGFLVAGSAFRTKSAFIFLSFRVLRIVPALMVEVSLSALILGPLLTSFTLSQYFTDPEFFEYFGNIIGHVKYYLPGLFITNPTPLIVNGNLWTFPAGFYCYAVIAVLIATGIFFSREKYSLVFIGGMISFIVFDNQSTYAAGMQRFALFAVAYFFVGALFFQWRNKISLNGWIFVVCGLIVHIKVISAGPLHDGLEFVVPFALTYVTVFLGFVRFPKISFLQGGDYSYGLYLYGFPVSQALVTTIAPIEGRPIILYFATLTVTFIFAALSWHLFEKSALKLKRRFSKKALY